LLPKCVSQWAARNLFLSFILSEKAECAEAQIHNPLAIHPDVGLKIIGIVHVFLPAICFLNLEKIKIPVSKFNRHDHDKDYFNVIQYVSIMCR